MFYINLPDIKNEYLFRHRECVTNQQIDKTYYNTQRRNIANMVVYI